MSPVDAIAYKETTRQQWQSAAEAWRRWDPVLRGLLGEATDVMLEMAIVRAGSHVLDVAAGAGEPALTAARRVLPHGRVVATDISSNILALASDAARAEGLDSVLQTQVMDGEHLQLPDASFDAVISRLGVMYFPNLHGGLVEMHRVLRPGGRAAVVVFSVPDRNGFFSIPVSIIRRHAQLPAPAPGDPGPFSLSRPGVLAEAFRAAGFTDVEDQLVTAAIRLPSAAECVRMEQESFGALHAMLAGLSEPDRAAAWAEVGLALHQFEHTDGFVGPSELLVVAGTKPRPILDR
jgi:ubiquinone/menaquinone biosynthesis C-methylase UbiE